MPIHPHINTAWQNRQLVLFIGGDLPRDVTGVPSRAEMARTLMPDQAGITLAEAADSQNAVDPIQACCQYVQDAPPPSHDFYQLIFELVQKQPNLTIVTTAYDNRLKKHFESMDVQTNDYVFDRHLGQRKANCPKLYYLFGLTSQPESLIVRQRDHLQLRDNPNRRNVMNAARSAIYQNTVLFIGYTFSDAECVANE
jgi:hypothetical protein